jgi:hypothetical protein
MRAAVVDPDSKILLDQDPTNDWAVAAGHSSGTTARIEERSIWWAEVLGGTLAP